MFPTLVSTMPGRIATDVTSGSSSPNVLAMKVSSQRCHGSELTIPAQRVHRSLARVVWTPARYPFNCSAGADEDDPPTIGALPEKR
jgi:hypothetical protein